MQRFAGRNVTTTGLFCRQAVPYLADGVVTAVRSLPVRERHGGRTMAALLAELSPALARVPLDSGLPTQHGMAAWPRRATALGRKALRRTGPARVAHRLAPVPVVPWGRLRETRGLRAVVADALAADARIGAVVDRDGVRRIVDDGLAGGPLYPLGMLVTLEATLRELWP